jgi:poly-gamma-glutamate capsule biosynthesis protein CapA/YwtB (metallophosphatase superfamily)
MQDQEKIDVLLTGDIMLGGNLDDLLCKEGFDFPFKPLSSCYTVADIVFGNLEAPLSCDGVPQKNKILLHQNSRAPVGLKDAGYDILSIANNHIMDYGEDALIKTIDILEEHGLGYVGAGADISQATKPVEFLRKGVKISFLAYASSTSDESNPLISAGEHNAGVALLDIRNIKEDINALRKEHADIIAVSLHWGLDRYHYPLPEQIGWAHEIIDAGANIIIGHHSHCLQAVEIYKKGIIAYSLGNFVFGDFLLPNGNMNIWTKRNRATALLRVTIAKEGVMDYEIIPVFVNGNGQLRVLKGLRRQKMLKSITEWSDAVEDPFYRKNYRKRVRKEGINIFFEKIASKLRI